MLAAFATAADAADPLAALEVGDRPEPELRDGWALLDVEAASLNHHDLWTLRGVSSRPIHHPAILGCDAAGTVAAHGGEPPPGAPPVGARVVAHSVVSCGRCDACRRGEEVFCAQISLLSEGDVAGALAERVQVPAANLVTLPDGVGFVDAACLPTAYLTAYRMLFVRGGVLPGGAALIHGATGGVATAAILLCRAAGVRAFVTARDDAGRELARSLGAADAFAADRDAAKRVLAATGGRGADVVVETVGEPTWEVSIRAVRPGGVIVVSGATGGANPPARLSHVFWRQFSVAGSSMGTRAELERLVAMVAAGALRPLVDRTAPLAEARSLFEQLAGGRQRGKLVAVRG